MTHQVPKSSYISSNRWICTAPRFLLDFSRNDGARRDMLRTSGVASRARHVSRTRTVIPSRPCGSFKTKCATWLTVRLSRKPYSTLPQSHDDATLREIFDSPEAWHLFAGRSELNSWKGLFENHFLSKPESFEDFAQATVQRCQSLVTKTLKASTIEDYRQIPEDLDRLSDALCRLLDVSEFVRSTHPDASFQAAADGAFAVVYEYMNVLNTTPNLNGQLRKAMDSSEVTAGWTQAEMIVAETLHRDFLKSAIHMPEQKRRRFVNVSSEISRLGRKFVQNMGSAEDEIAVNGSQLKGLDPSILPSLRRHRGKYHLPTSGPNAYLAMKALEDEEVRRHLHIAMRTSTVSQIATLEHLLQLRAELAQLSGFNTYAQLSLSDKMAKTPEAVMSFLTALASDNAVHVEREVDKMSALIQPQCGSPNVPWNRAVYRRLLSAQASSLQSRTATSLSAYFSLGSVMQGLSRLFSRLYGISFRPVPTFPGETWHPSVRRLDVHSDTKGRVAVLYCDLFSRQGKSPNPAHFTLRGSRHITPTQISEAGTLFPHIDPLEAANDGMATTTVDGQPYQLPTIALICDFPSPRPYEPSPSASKQPPTLLSFQSLQTLFHEMGHAIHSILARTPLQVVSGTRTATDFVELPSVLMEHFAADASVLSLFARHWQTGDALPYDLVEEKIRWEKRGRGSDNEYQIWLALLDQVYHNQPATLRAPIDSTALLHALPSTHPAVPLSGTISNEPSTTTPQGFFGHLIEYGGSYYSYLFARAIASKVWKDVFSSGRDGGAIERDNGERFAKEVLRWGGSRDPWECVAGVIGDERLREGGREGMGAVGNWGVEA